MQVPPLASLSGLRIRCRLQVQLGSGVAVAVAQASAAAPIQPLACELPYAAGAALKIFFIDFSYKK